METWLFQALAYSGGGYGKSETQEWVLLIHPKIHWTEKSSERCSIIFLSLSLAFFDWFLENRGPYPEVVVQETGYAIGEINV